MAEIVSSAGRGWCPSIACIKGLQRDAGRWLIESVDECQIALR
jgi:hypothetical protein